MKRGNIVFTIVFFVAPVTGCALDANGPTYLGFASTSVPVGFVALAYFGRPRWFWRWLFDPRAE